MSYNNNLIKLAEPEDSNNKSVLKDPCRECELQMPQLSAHTQGFPHVLVEVDGIRVLHELPDHLPLVVLHHQHFLRLSHPTHHQETHLPRDIKIICQDMHTSDV